MTEQEIEAAHSRGAEAACGQFVGHRWDYPASAPDYRPAYRVCRVCWRVEDWPRRAKVVSPAGEDDGGAR